MMKNINVSSDIIPIGEFKSSMAKWLNTAKNTGQPLIITQNGRPAAVLLSPEEFDNLQYNKLFVDSVTRGISDIESGKVYETQQLKEELKKRRK
jgi:prevent-host-death family protein